MRAPREPRYSPSAKRWVKLGPREQEEPTLYITGAGPTPRKEKPPKIRRRRKAQAEEAPSKKRKGRR
jgi:hypothetical protein